MEKLIITAALTGAEISRDKQPALPIIPDEICEDAIKCLEAGASIVHIHAREDDGKPTQSVNKYNEIKEKINNKSDLIVQPSTGGATWHSLEERMQPLFINPEMATLSTGTCNFGDDIFSNPQEYIVKFAEEMKNRKIKPEIEVFERGMIENALKLVKKGILELPLHFDFVMGVPGAIPGNIKDLIYMVDCIPDNCTWTVAGIGRYELPLAVHAIAMGGHVRVGFEDNIYFKRGVLATSNAQLVHRIANISEEFGREIATPEEARRILNIGG